MNVKNVLKLAIARPRFYTLLLGLALALSGCYVQPEAAIVAPGPDVVVEGPPVYVPPPVIFVGPRYYRR